MDHKKGHSGRNRGEAAVPLPLATSGFNLLWVLVGERSLKPDSNLIDGWLVTTDEADDGSSWKLPSCSKKTR